MLPISGTTMETDSISGALLSIYVKVTSKGTLPQDSPHRAPSERDVPFLEPSFIYLTSPVYKPTSPLPGSPVGPLWREMPVSRAFLTHPPGFPVKSPPPGYPQREMLHF